jgi:hypothetical protein
VHDQQRLAVVRREVDVRGRGRANAVRNAAGQPLFLPEGVRDPDNGAAIPDPDHQRAAGGIGEGHQGLEDGRQGGQIALELQRFSLSRGDQFRHVHETYPPEAFRSGISPGRV